MSNVTLMCMDADPVAGARELVAALYPQARWALLTGSVITAARTAGSDLDMVVLLPDNDPSAPHRESRLYRDWPAELFVHDEQTLEHYLAKELAARKPHLHRMVGTGVAIAGDPGQRPEQCARVLAAGPPALTEAQRQWVRYGLTDLLDDLEHAHDDGERAVIACHAWQAAGKAVLSLNGRWDGSGKWLLREIRDFDPETATEWLAAQHDPHAVTNFARRLLECHGGPLFDGYRADGERPSPSPQFAIPVPGTT